MLSSKTLIPFSAPIHYFFFFFFSPRGVFEQTLPSRNTCVCVRNGNADRPLTITARKAPLK